MADRLNLAYHVAADTALANMGTYRLPADYWTTPENITFVRHAHYPRLRGQIVWMDRSHVKVVWAGRKTPSVMPYATITQDLPVRDDLDDVEGWLSDA